LRRREKEEDGGEERVRWRSSRERRAREGGMVGGDLQVCGAFVIIAIAMNVMFVGSGSDEVM
jgi:hypothetical protein